MNKSIKKLIDFLRKKGWKVEVSRNKHYKAVISKEMFTAQVTFSSTPSDINAIRNIVKDFRKAIQAGGFHTLDNYRSYFLTQMEFEDTFIEVINRLDIIATAGGLSEEATGHLEVLQQLFNVAHDECFTDDAAAIEQWINSKKPKDT